MLLRLSALCVSLLLLLGLTPSVWAAEEEPETIYVYSASEEHLVRPLLDIFEKESGIHVKMTTVDRAALDSRLALEGEDTPADAVIVADVANLYPLQASGLLQPVTSDVIKQNIPQMLRQKDDLWMGVAMRSRIYFINKDICSISTSKRIHN